MQMEHRLVQLLHTRGVEVKRAHPVDEKLGHGFIWTQRMGMDVFESIPRCENRQNGAEWLCGHVCGAVMRL